MPKLFQIRQRSLARGNILVFAAVALSIPLSHFPRLEPSVFVLIPSLLAFLGLVDTARCIQPRWSFYHAGVILCLYMDLMAISFILFLFLYPYFLWISHQ